MFSIQTNSILGAGPSGLVTAKTLIHNYPEGAFIPTIFEKSHVLGGLWSATADIKEHGSHPGNGLKETQFVSPSMPTNLSRFTVSFSDLAWESVDSLSDGDNVPMFPKAWQVGRYLEKYAELYVPREVLRFGCRVVKTLRQKSDGEDGAAKWTVEWVDNNEVHVESFDFLVVASGYFSRPYIPEIPGLRDVQDQVIHSSSLRDVDGFLSKRPYHSGGKVVVVGGSLSGAEAASALALHLSSLTHSPGNSNQKRTEYTVHHVSSRPFWCVPTYVPKAASENPELTSFQPLDLVMYDLSRRPPGTIEYSIGPVAPERSIMINQYFKSLLGTDQKTLGSGNLTPTTEGNDTRPPWVAISDSYAEYIRSGAIDITIGRVEAVRLSPDHRNMELNVRLSDKEQSTLNDVVAIVFATGFSPCDSLSFLPEDVLSTLEYSPEEAFIPIILDTKGLMNSEIPDLGFVGMYRGPYWGVMEMQARALAKYWSSNATEKSDQPSHRKNKSQDERQRFLELRQADPRQSRAQFPMGDYVGLMESFARDLDISRFELPGLDERSGPVIPSRYVLPCRSSERVKAISERETAIVLDSLQDVLSNKKNIVIKSVAKAVFRALHGRWNFIEHRYLHRDELDDSENGVVESTSGVAAFHPRYPSAGECSGEYLYEEDKLGSRNTDSSSYLRRSDSTTCVYRLREWTQNSPNDYLSIWTAEKEIDPKMAQKLFMRLEFEPFSPDSLIRARSRRLSDPRLVTDDLATQANDRKYVHEYEYRFRMEGINIFSWELLVYRCSLVEEKNKSEKTEGKAAYRDRGRQLLSKKVYER